MAVQDPVKWFRRQTAPVTVIMCALVVIGWFATWTNPTIMVEALGYPGVPFPKVWTLITYPFVEFKSPIFLLIQVMWLYWVGSMLERDHGSRKFIYLLVAVSIVGALPLTLFHFPVSGMLIPDAILVAMWATRYPNMTIRLFMCIPVAAKWLGIIIVASVFFLYATGPGQILIGLTAISGCILAWLYARNMIPRLPYGLGYGSYVKAKPSRGQKVKEQEYFDDVYRREKDREEKERLRKLFEDSLEDKK